MARIRRVGDDAFTLIELLVVVLIIGILSAIAIPALLGQQEEAKDAAAVSDLTLARTALIGWSTSHEGAYTEQLTDLDTFGYAQSQDVTGTVITITAAANTFCIEAVSPTGHEYHVTELSAVVDGLCP